MQLYLKYFKSNHFKFTCVASSGYLLVLGYLSKEAFSFGKHAFCPAATYTEHKNKEQYEKQHKALIASRPFIDSRP